MGWTDEIKNVKSPLFKYPCNIWNIVYGSFFSSNYQSLILDLFTSTKRTKVIDDEADYFSMDNRWLSKNQQKSLAKRDKELREKRFASRLDQKFTLDFAGRRIVEAVEENCKLVFIIVLRLY